MFQNKDYYILILPKKLLPLHHNKKLKTLSPTATRLSRLI